MVMWVLKIIWLMEILNAKSCCGIISLVFFFYQLVSELKRWKIPVHYSKCVNFWEKLFLKQKLNTEMSNIEN